MNKCNDNKQRSQRGFTLFELVVVVMLAGMIMAGLASSLGGGMGAYTATRNGIEGLAQLRFATERIAREVRNMEATGAGYTITTMSNNQLDFTNWQGIQVSIDATSLPVVSLSYSTVPGVIAPLADKVTNFNLAYYQMDGITPSVGNLDIAFVEITVAVKTGDGSMPQRTRIAMRTIL